MWDEKEPEPTRRWFSTASRRSPGITVRRIPSRRDFEQMEAIHGEVFGGSEAEPAE